MERSELDKLGVRVQEVINKTETLLKGRGISNIEAGKPENLQLSILGMTQQENIRDNYSQVMEELSLNTDAVVTIEKRIVRFNESVQKGPLADKFPKRSNSQELTLYSFPLLDKYQGIAAPVVIFSHGGAVRPDTSLKSSFLTIIKEQFEKTEGPLILAAMDHRGSDSNENMYKYSLEDRTADIEVVVWAVMNDILPEFKKMGVNWNGELVLIGNSMGGHVAVIAAKELKPERLVLPQPAAYSEKAQILPFGNDFHTEIIKENSWKTSQAFDALESYLKEGGRCLIIGAQEDETIPGKITKRYMKEITFAYMDRAVGIDGDKSYQVGYMYIPTSHKNTTKDEISKISTFISTSDI